MDVAKHYVPRDAIAGHKVGFVAGALGERITVDGRHDRLELRTWNAIEREERNCKEIRRLVFATRISFQGPLIGKAEVNMAGIERSPRQCM